MRLFLLSCGALLGLGLAMGTVAPADAQQYRSRTVLVYGDDPCPTSSNPDEIIICARRPEEERYRIPKELREQEKAEEIARRDQVGASRAALVDGRSEATGIGSCSAAGAGGMIGCNKGVNVLGAARTVVEGVRTATEPTDD